MYNLRQTWPGIFPNSRLYMIDVKVHEIDPAWPISEAALAGRDKIAAAGPLPAAGTTTIHVNPRFVGGPSVGFVDIFCWCWGT